MTRKNQKQIPPADRAAPGDIIADGTIFVGVSPETGKPMYTTPADAPLSYTFNEAGNYAAALNAHGHNDWRVPTRAELNVLFENHDRGALKGTFNVTGNTGDVTRLWPTEFYWSSNTYGYDFTAASQRFRDGLQGWYDKDLAMSLRCVR